MILSESLTKQELVEDMRKEWGDAEAEIYASKENELDIAVREYYELKSEVDAKTKKLKEMNKALIELLIEQYDTKKYVGDNYSATITFKEKIKYDDETKLINLLLKDEVLKQYVVQSINATGLNNEIKEHESVANKLIECYTKNTETSLSVKKL